MREWLFDKLGFVLFGFCWNGGEEYGAVSLLGRSAPPKNNPHTILRSTPNRMCEAILPDQTVRENVFGFILVLISAQFM